MCDFGYTFVEGVADSCNEASCPASAIDGTATCSCTPSTQYSTLSFAAGSWSGDCIGMLLLSMPASLQRSNKLRYNVVRHAQQYKLYLLRMIPSLAPLPTFNNISQLILFYPTDCTPILNSNNKVECTSGDDSVRSTDFACDVGFTYAAPDETSTSGRCQDNGCPAFASGHPSACVCDAGYFGTLTAATDAGWTGTCTRMSFLRGSFSCNFFCCSAPSLSFTLFLYLFL